MSSTEPQIWRCRDRELSLGRHSVVMGILNVTPDSFSDGGWYTDIPAAVLHAEQMLRDGAGVIDVGGESTRPGAAAVDADEEVRRVIPVVDALAGSSGLISIDTMKASVAEQAVEHGAHILNDVSAGTADDRMLDVAASTGAGIVLMHMQGSPRTMQSNPVYDDVVHDVCEYLKRRAEQCLRHGVDPSRIVLDPGIGFGKTVDHNLALLRAVSVLKEEGYIVLIGVSRKSFIGKLLDREVSDRLEGSLGAAAFARMKGADIFRVHDVKQTCDTLRMIDILACEEYVDDRSD